MYYKVYQVDSFSDGIYRGNPACVIHLNEWLMLNFHPCEGVNFNVY